MLGSVFLAVTGAEALYADMGHFGRRPIQAAWLFLVLPALIANYLGQGALIMQRSEGGRESLLSAGAGLGAAAADPAFDGGDRHRQPGGHHRRVFVVSQVDPARSAAASGNHPHLGQLRRGRSTCPAINRILLLGVLALVLLFRSSDALANAYGIAVAGTMVATTALAFFVVWKLWRWPLWGALALISAFLSIDIGFYRQPL